MKKIALSKAFIAIFTILILFANLSFAAYSDVQMTVESEPECRIYITDNSYFEKKLISKDLENKEVTIQLSVVNNEIPDKPTGELVIVLDNSLSMTEKTPQGVQRLEAIHSAAKKLITSFLTNNNQLKIGIVRFSTNDENDGTIEDAAKVSDLSNDSSALSAAIDTIPHDGDATDLDAGLTLGNQLFSGDTKQKYMLVLTDGVPNVAIGYDGMIFSQDATDKTVAKLKSIENSGIKLFTMLTGIDEESAYPYPGCPRTYAQIIQQTFGTQENPTAGKFYYITDDQIEKTITETISEDLAPIYKTLTNIKVVDYFPQYIIDNFDFSYVTEATHGEISAQVDTSNNSITWTIPKLEAGETATVQYKLKLKEGFDPEILDELLNTNDHVDLTYDDFDGKPTEKSSDISPQLKLTEPATPAPITPEPVAPSIPKTESPIILPKAGKVITTLALITVSGISLFSLIKYIKYKDIK